MTKLMISVPDEQAQRLAEEAERRGVSMEELALRGIQMIAPSRPASTKSFMESLEELHAMLPPGFKAPTDEEADQMLEEALMEKYGGNARSSGH